MANEETSSASGLNRHLEELLTCSICISTFVDPFVTPCGHSFCYSCIHQHLAAFEGGKGRLGGNHKTDAERAEEESSGEARPSHASSLCPQCSAPLRRDQLNPSFALKGVVKYWSQARQHASQEQGPYLTLKHLLGSNKEYLSSKELEQLRVQVQEYKQDAERKEKAGTLNLLLHFLHQSKEEKAKRLEAIKKEIECLDADISACSEIGNLGGAFGEGLADEVGEAMARVGAALDPRPATEGSDKVRGEAEMGADRGDGERCGAMLDDAVREKREQHGHRPERGLHGDIDGRSGDLMDKQDGGNASNTVATGKTAYDEEEREDPDASARLGDAANRNGTTTMNMIEMKGARSNDVDSWNIGKSNSTGDLLCSNKRRRIASQFEDLQSVYLQLRSAGRREAETEEAGDQAGTQNTPFRGDPSNPAARQNVTVAGTNIGGTAGTTTSGLQKFSKILGTLAHSNHLRILAEIPRPPLRNQSSIISSVEYDRTGKFFATAGVSKRISVFDHTSTMANANQGLPIANCPIVEMVTRSKLSCISWNKFINTELASSDYEGVLNVWDTSTGNLVHEYEAHSKRIWSVDFCCADPKLLATGSDDSFVKVWSTRSPSAIAQCDVKANVCAVKWHPTQPHTVAIGAADHTVYIFDMRKYDSCMASFRGHKKAVSYVRWAGTNDIISASTDCTLRLWNTQRAALAGGQCTQEDRTYRGHVNERNFVGLAVSNDLILCGSETHEVYTYYKPLSKPITKIALPISGGVGVSGIVHPRDTPFVSAVAWHPTKRELLSATSQGSVFILRLEGELDRDDEDMC